MACGILDLRPIGAFGVVEVSFGGGSISPEILHPGFKTQKHRGFQKPWFVGSSDSCALLDPYRKHSDWTPSE